MVVPVVGLVACEEAGGVPFFDGDGVDVEVGGDFLEGEESLRA